MSLVPFLWLALAGLGMFFAPERPLTRSDVFFMYALGLSQFWFAALRIIDAVRGDKQ